MRTEIIDEPIRFLLYGISGVVEEQRFGEVGFRLMNESGSSIGSQLRRNALLNKTPLIPYKRNRIGSSIISVLIGTLGLLKVCRVCCRLAARFPQPAALAESRPRYRLPGDMTGRAEIEAWGLEEQPATAFSGTRCESYFRHQQRSPLAHLLISSRSGQFDSTKPITVTPALRSPRNQG